MDRWMNRWVDWINVCMDEWVDRIDVCMYGWMNGWVDVSDIISL